MPTYVYTCSHGHHTEEVRSVEQRNTTSQCACGKLANRDNFAEIRASKHQVIATIPEHFNRSLGCKVVGPKHLRQLQKEKGMSDYDTKDFPIPTDWK